MADRPLVGIFPGHFPNHRSYWAHILHEYVLL